MIGTWLCCVVTFSNTSTCINNEESGSRSRRNSTQKCKQCRLVFIVDFHDASHPAKKVLKSGQRTPKPLTGSQHYAAQ